MKVVILNNTEIVTIGEDKEEFNIDLIKSIYDDDITLTTQEFNMTVDEFRKYGHIVKDGVVILEVNEDPVIPPKSISEEIEDLKHRQDLTENALLTLLLKGSA